MIFNASMFKGKKTIFHMVFGNGILYIIVFILFASCVSSPQFTEIKSLRFPSPELILDKKPGAFHFETYRYRGRVVDMGTILVPENRNQPESRLIPLPFMRYRAVTKTPLEPVLFLNGGPGIRNIDANNYMVDVFQEAHDTLYMGYRGIDGRTTLRAPTFSSRITMMLQNHEPVTLDLVKELSEAFKIDLGVWKQEKVDFEGYNTNEVVDDIENVRTALGYSKINIFAQSYGTRLAYYYSLRYPQHVNRSVQQGLNAPGRNHYEKDHLERFLGLYNQIWQADPKAVKLSPDLIQTWRKVLTQLPVTINGTIITQDFLSMAMYSSFFITAVAPEMFGSLISAEHGDFVPLSNILSNIKISAEEYNADKIFKGATSDFDNGENYLSEITENNPGTIRFTSMLWAMAQIDSSFIKLIPEEYRTWSDTDVDTILINGTLDPSSPIWDLDEYARHYKKGKLIVVPEVSHSDVFNSAPMLWKDLVLTYYRTGKFDENRIPISKVKLY